MSEVRQDGNQQEDSPIASPSGPPAAEDARPRDDLPCPGQLVQEDDPRHEVDEPLQAEGVLGSGLR